MPPKEAAQVLVVGAGLAGLSCARLLQAAGMDVVVLEASDAVGGRIRTDEVAGFRLDRGFQVLLTAYEEVQSQVDLPALALGAFKPGSLIWTGRALERMGDPFRDPGSALASVGARVGTFGDKLRVAKLRSTLLAGSAEACFAGPERSTLEELRALGFTADFIDTFFRPFLGGVFLERDLDTSASLFRYYFRCFAAGDATLPSGGMQRLPESLARGLGDRVRLGARVTAVDDGAVRLEQGGELRAEHVVVAVDGSAAARLLGTPAPAWKATVTSYFAAPEPPVTDPMLVLDGEGTGPVNHVAVPSLVAAGYAPAGTHLVSASGVDAAAADPEAFRAAAPAQLRRWFGASVDRWEHLKSYRVAEALPRHPAGTDFGGRGATRPDGVIVAGDHTAFGAIQGALLSGRRAAETVLERL